MSQYIIKDNQNRCVQCNQAIPEGAHVCYECSLGDRPTEKSLLWQRALLWIYKLKDKGD